VISIYDDLSAGHISSGTKVIALSEQKEDCDFSNRKLIPGRSSAPTGDLLGMELQ